MANQVYLANTNNVLPRKGIYWSRVSKYLDWNQLWYKSKARLLQESSGKHNTRKFNQVLGNLVWTYNLQETYVDDAGP